MFQTSFTIFNKIKAINENIFCVTIYINDLTSYRCSLTIYSKERRGGTMKKTLYSLMLSDDVVREIDIIAHGRGTNRSNLINQILAEYVSIMTPEKRIEDIFRAVEGLMTPSRELAAFTYPNQTTMALKSSLAYKYRPTVKYEVQLSRDDGPGIGELAVIFRTQSQMLIEALTEFFKCWVQIEQAYLPRRNEHIPTYALYDSRFTRSIMIDHSRNYSIDDIAGAISDYIKLFDSCMKAYISDSATINDLERRYLSYIQTHRIVI